MGTLHVPGAALLLQPICRGPDFPGQLGVTRGVAQERPQITRRGAGVEALSFDGVIDHPAGVHQLFEGVDVEVFALRLRS